MPRNPGDSGLYDEHRWGGTPDELTPGEHPSPEQRLVQEMLNWMHEANSRLEYEIDKTTGYQFGGNPEMNPIFKAAKRFVMGGAR